MIQNQAMMSMRDKFQCKGVWIVFIDELVCKGSVIFLIPNITCQLATRDVGDQVVIKPCISYTLWFNALHQDPPGILQENTSIPLDIICN